MAEKKRKDEVRQKRKAQREEKKNLNANKDLGKDGFAGNREKM